MVLRTKRRAAQVDLASVILFLTVIALIVSVGAGLFAFGRGMWRLYKKYVYNIRKAQRDLDEFNERQRKTEERLDILWNFIIRRAKVEMADKGWSNFPPGPP